MDVKNLKTSGVTDQTGRSIDQLPSSGGWRVRGKDHASDILVKEHLVNTSTDIAVPFYGTYVHMTYMAVTGSLTNVVVGNNASFACTVQFSDGHSQNDGCGAVQSITPSNLAATHCGCGQSAYITGSAEGSGSMQVLTCNTYYINAQGNTGFGTGSISVSVICPYPINFRQTSAADVGGGVLRFTYEWDSSNNVRADLKNCVMGEKLTIAPANNPWPLPYPNFLYATNPYVGPSFPATLTGSTDNHYTATVAGGWRPPFFVKSFRRLRTIFIRAPARTMVVSHGWCNW